MITPRWRKILSDLWSNKARTMLVALSIAVGVFAVGAVSTSYLIMNEEIPAAFQAVDANHARIYSDLFDDDLLETVKNTPGVAQVEGRTQAGAKVKTLTGQKVDVIINGIPPVDKMQVDKVKLISGSPVLGSKEIYLERSTAAPLGVKVGDTITLELQDERTRVVRVAGFVQDINTSPFAVSQIVFSYTSPETVEWLGGTRQYTNMLVRVRENATNEAHVRQVARLVSDKINRSGRQVYMTIIFRPGIHPAQSTIDAAMGLLAGMAVLSIFLSTFLVINTITALLGQQVRQIGVMKAVGATMGQVIGIYLVLILAFGVIALIFSIPLAGLVGYGLAASVNQMLLNLDPSPFRIPTPALLLMVIIGLGVPLFAGIVPVLNGARLTVREAISNYGITTGGGRSFFDRILESVQILPRPLLISIRNTFRRKARLALTLFTLMLGGAIFIGVFNVRASMYAEIEQTFNYVLSDLNVGFNRLYRLDRIRQTIKDVPGVVTMETWGGAMGQVMRPDGNTGDDIEIIAPPANSQLIKPILTDGRWLVEDDDNAVVVGNHYMKLRPETKVGDILKIKINERQYLFKVVGIYKMAGTALYPVLYMNREYLNRLLNQGDQVSNIRIVTDKHDLASQQKVAKLLTDRFAQDGIAVGSILPSAQIIAQQSVTIDVLIYLLLFMAVLIAVVGGLGLMGTMSMNVLERTREIGVMRSIGAVDMSIMQLVIVEGMFIGAISWGLGALLSIPISKMLDSIIGVSLLNVPMQYRFSMGGLVIWIVVVLILSALACILPARNAVRLTIRDVLAYE